MSTAYPVVRHHTAAAVVPEQLPLYKVHIYKRAPAAASVVVFSANLQAVPIFVDSPLFLHAGSASMLYQLSTDADAITEQLTQAFLEQMWTQLAANTPNGQNPANGGDTTGLTMSLLGPGTNETQVLQILVSVAKDILSYFRYHRSQALLPLLRQFSERGSLALADVDPDALRTEIQDLLNVTTMGRWYADVSNYDVSTLIMTPAGGSSASNQVRTRGVDHCCSLVPPHTAALSWLACFCS